MKWDIKTTINFILPRSIPSFWWRCYTIRLKYITTSIHLSVIIIIART